MKCDNYKLLIEKLEEEKISTNEMNALIQHLTNCGNCRQEYQSVLKYKQITKCLKNNIPVLHNKEILIDQILLMLPDKEEENQKEKAKTFFVIPFCFRLAISSVAAALVLFFCILQITDALQIKRLETSYADKQAQPDFATVKANLLIKFLNNNNDFKFRDWTKEFDLRLMIGTIKNLSYQDRSAKYQFLKDTDSDFNFIIDSNNHY